MDVYIYCADIYCADCGRSFQDRLRCEPELNTFIDGASNEDSDHWPQGPYGDGGGEADSPQCCGACLTFLENPLTGDGYAYVREMAADRSSASSVVREWLEFYNMENEES